MLVLEFVSLSTDCNELHVEALTEQLDVQGNAVDAHTVLLQYIAIGRISFPGAVDPIRPVSGATVLCGEPQHL